MTDWVIVNNADGTATAGKDGMFFTLSSQGLSNDVHAVRFNTATNAGEIESKDALTGKISGNSDISEFSGYAGWQDKWQSAYDSELQRLKEQAYELAYNEVIANEGTEAEAVSAGNVAKDAVTSVIF